MNKKRTMLNSPPTPGEVLRSLIIEKVKITQEDLANAMGVSRFSINQIINQRRNVTAEMALRLGKATNTSAEFWLNLQREIDLFEAHRKVASELEKIKPVRARVSGEELLYNIVD